MKDGLRFWKIAVGLLIICNIGLMLIIWLKPQQETGRQPRPETPREYVIKQLKFTEEQTKSYDQLIKDHQEAMHRLRDQGRELRQQLFENLKGNNSRDQAADSITRLIGSNQAQIELVTYNHFVKVKAICTEAQKAEFDRIIGDVTKKMNGPGGGRPPHEGPPPPEGSMGPPPGGEGNPPPPPGDR
jgi:protein CpxP